MSEILDRMLGNIPSEFDKSIGSFFYDLSKASSLELDIIYNNLEQILLQGFAKTATGEYLDIKVAEQGLTRKTATKAYGYVTITGTVGAVVSAGVKVASDNLIFSVVGDYVLSGTTASVLVECDTDGNIGNVTAGSIKSFPVTLPGITAVTNAEAFTGGYDTETDDELRERYFDKLNTPSTSGNKQDYSNWAKEVSGVGDVKVLPLWDGNGTVKVIIVDSNKNVAGAELVQSVADNIENNRPVGAEVTVESATPLAINVSATLVLSATATVETVADNVENAIENYIKGVAFNQDYISIAKIGGAILSCDGVLDYTDLTVNGGTLNIDVLESEVPVLGVVTLA